MSEIEEKEYEPYGDEWKKDVMKLPKAAIVDLFAKLGKKYNEGFQKITVETCIHPRFTRINSTSIYTYRCEVCGAKF